ncbi:hypothetical protein FS749_010048 [Ceratobasidium sp. UAMH 11750]|nr:hypothetical protein FS749_010048 [Ceratobasidium sp. UAMH 11750]
MNLPRSLSQKILASYDSGSPFLVWEPKIFTFAGGLSRSDVGLLLDILFDERKTLLYVWLESGVSGLSTLLVIIWQFAISQSGQSTWERLDVLQRRNYVASPKVDGPIVRALFKPFALRPIPAKVYSNCVDHEDAQLLLSAFRHNLSFIHIVDSYPLLLWLSDAVDLETLTREVGTGNAYTPTLVDLSRDYFVHIAQAYHYRSGPPACHMRVGILLGMHVWSSIYDPLMNHQLSLTLVEKALSESQMIALAGQAYLHGISFKLDIDHGNATASPNLYRYISTAHKGMVKNLRLMTLANLSLSIAPGSVSPGLAQVHVDWSRLLIQLHMLLALHDVKFATHEEHHQIWLDLGQALGFQLYSSQRCAYPRCLDSGPVPYVNLMVCGSCYGEYYCSYACQRADWALDVSTSHMGQCLEIESEVV